MNTPHPKHSFCSELFDRHFDWRRNEVAASWQADDRSKMITQITADLNLKVAEQLRSKVRCEVMNIASA